MIELRNISKHFGGVRALTDVSLRIDRGHVHGLMGENGAGKSTLGKVLSGIHTPDTGEILLDGKPHRFRSPADALAAGVGMVHQELAFCPDLSVAENLCMGHYPRRRGLVDRAAMRMRASQLLQEIGLSIDVDRPMRDLSTAQEQGVQIAAAVGTNARVIVFDEPTASLSARESEALFELIGKLKARGITLIYVSHRMPEVLALCDTISVLRDGAYVGELSRGQATHEKLVEMMTGRVINMDRTGGTRSPGPVRLAVRGLCSPGKFSDISFDVRAGEIVGVAGLVGAGRSEVACAIFGLDARASGKVLVDDKPLKLGSVTRSIGAGISLVPEDRKRQGLVLSMSVRHNTTLASLDLISTGPILNLARDECTASDMVTRLGTKTASIDTPVRQLSGGNQQKVVIGKWLARSGVVLIVDEPTRGVDIGAKQVIHQLLDRLARQGTAILMISSELPELLASADRILVMREGRLLTDVPSANADEQILLRLMVGTGGTAA
ncbi:MAG: sugar ABC transporter ATP-binding protein [Actinomycetes bacterium]|jgi:ABC-type sugar transport system ATPase subunit